MRICLLSGGQSTEHAISLISATNVLHAMPSEHQVLTVGIDRNGNWFWYPDHNFAIHTDDAARVALASGGHPVFPCRRNGKAWLTVLDNSAEDQPFDLLFPVLHGMNGEDGTVQGMAQLLGCPCVGCGMTASAICMDKTFAKRILEQAGIRTARWTEVRKGEKIPDVSSLGLPLFVKPASGGSSVGVKKVTRLQDLEQAVENALAVDQKALIEECIKGREIECAVLGNDKTICPAPGEIVSAVEFYDFDAKYTSADGAVVKAPTELSPAAEEQVRSLARRIFYILGCSGLSRVDFFYTAEGEWILNEINTMPGFTNISMYPKLMQAAGISYQDLIARLIQLAVEPH